MLEQIVASFISRTASIHNVKVCTNIDYYPSYKFTKFGANIYVNASRVKPVTSQHLSHPSNVYIYHRLTKSNQSASDRRQNLLPTANQH